MPRVLDSVEIKINIEISEAEELSNNSFEIATNALRRLINAPASMSLESILNGSPTSGLIHPDIYMRARRTTFTFNVSLAAINMELNASANLMLNANVDIGNHRMSSDFFNSDVFNPAQEVLSALQNSRLLRASGTNIATSVRARQEERNSEPISSPILTDDLPQPAAKRRLIRRK